MAIERAHICLRSQCRSDHVARPHQIVNQLIKRACRQSSAYVLATGLDANGTQKVSLRAMAEQSPAPTPCQIATLLHHNVTRPWSRYAVPLAWCWNLSESTRAIMARDTYLEESRVHLSARVRRRVNRVRSWSARGYIFVHVLDAGAILTTAGNGFRARCIARREEDRAARTPNRLRTA